MKKSMLRWWAGWGLCLKNRHSLALDDTYIYAGVPACRVICGAKKGRIAPPLSASVLLATPARRRTPLPPRLVARPV